MIVDWIVKCDYKNCEKEPDSWINSDLFSASLCESHMKLLVKHPAQRRYLERKTKPIYG